MHVPFLVWKIELRVLVSYSTKLRKKACAYFKIIIMHLILRNYSCMHKRMHMHVSVNNLCSLQHAELKMNTEI